MSRFFTSDTHFGHARIIELCGRPFKDVSHMNETLIHNWNNVVGEDDTVYHLGDVALGAWVDWDKSLSRLNGHKILVVGNHDRLFQPLLELLGDDPRHCIGAATRGNSHHQGDGAPGHRELRARGRNQGQQSCGGQHHAAHAVPPIWRSVIAVSRTRSA